MAEQPAPRAGELVTANYGWTKPTVAGSTDAWGGYLNADLDGIDSTVFSVSGVANAALPKAGGTMTGPLTGTSANFSGAVTAANLSAPQAIGDNRIINGDMRIDQRNNGASGTAMATYTVDRWKYGPGASGKGTWGQNLNAITGPVGFPYYLGFQSSSAYTSIAGDLFNFNQSIEADMISDFAWGTANAQSVTLSFWARSSLTGTFSGVISNYAGTRSYPFTFSLPTANTWTKIVLTIPGDTAGTWVMSGIAGSVFLDFDLGAGSANRGPANAWASAAYNGATGAVSVVGTNGATFYVTGVKLEVGSVATPFNRQSLAKSTADCQRYYQSLYTFTGGYGVAGSVAYAGYFLPVMMRATPTVVFSGQAYLNASALASANITPYLFVAQITVTAAGTAYGQASTTFNAEL